MKKILILLLHSMNLVAVPAFSQSHAKSWTTAVLPDEVYQSITGDSHSVDERHFYTVQIIKCDTAVDALSQSAIVPLSDKDAKYYVGSWYEPKKNKKPFLVRGVCTNELGTFELTVSRGGVLIVNYISLGPKRSKAAPLVVLLEKAPTKVYVMETSAK